MMSALGATDKEHSALTTGTSGLNVPKLSVPVNIEIPFVCVFSPQQRNRLHFDDSSILSILSPFETVSFVSLSFSVEITGQAGRLWFAASGSDDLPPTDDKWLGCPVFQRFAGNAHGDTFAEYNFPATHPFGHELKATVLGNPSPRFYFKFSGSSGDTASVRGCVVVHGGGRGIIPAVSLVKYADNKSSSPKTDSAVAV